MSVLLLVKTVETWSQACILPLDNKGVIVFAGDDVDAILSCYWKQMWDVDDVEAK